MNVTATAIKNTARRSKDDVKQVMANPFDESTRFSASDGTESNRLGFQLISQSGLRDVTDTPSHARPDFIARVRGFPVTSSHAGMCNLS